MIRRFIRALQGEIPKKLDAIWDIHKKMAVRELLALAKYDDSKCLVRFGYKVYSQNDEDGIIQEIFRRIGITNRTFVEFGAGSGLENNTSSLLLQGWNGLWIDGNASHCHEIRKGLSKTIAAGRLKLSESFITRDNIDNLISSHVAPGEIDLLSVDIDGNDWEVFAAIHCVNARVVVAEYNAKFVPPIQYCLPYDPSHLWQETDRFGASLSFLVERMSDKGYALVGCNIYGINAFFVKQELVKDLFLAPFTAEKHFEPTRNELAIFDNGHPADYRTIDDWIHGGLQTAIE